MKNRPNEVELIFINGKNILCYFCKFLQKDWATEKKNWPTMRNTLVKILHHRNKEKYLPNVKDNKRSLLQREKMRLALGLQNQTADERRCVTENSNCHPALSFLGGQQKRFSHTWKVSEVYFLWGCDGKKKMTWRYGPMLKKWIKYRI